MRLLTSARIKLAFLSRVVVAVVLVLALLSSIAPFKSAAARNLCTMACCAGLPPHGAGSCHMEMPAAGTPVAEATPNPETDELCGLSEADDGATGMISGAVAGVMGMTTPGESSLNLDDVTVEASDHCQVNSRARDTGEDAGRVATGDAASSEDGNADQAPSIAAHSLAKPCPPECGSGTTVSRVRRTPDAATIARNTRRSTFVKKYFYQRQDFLILSACPEQVHPRGPPPYFS